MTSIDTITTVIARDDDSRTISRLQNRADDLGNYARSGYTLSSTITVPSGVSTIIIDTLTRDN